MNDPIGLLGSLIPALALLMASATRWIALSCPLTRFFMLFSRFNNLSFSLPTNLLIGIFVHLDIIDAIFSSSIVSLNISDLFCFCKLFNSSSILGITPWRSFAAVSRS